MCVATDIVTAFGTAVAAAAAVYAAWVGINSYKESITVQLAQTLLQAETMFKESLPVYALIEDMARYRSEVAPVLTKAIANDDLTDQELALVISVDRAVRFFYIFLIHRRFRDDTNRILKAYAYYWSLMSDDGERRELRIYLDKFYPGTAWDASREMI
jgi:hypothetical protein